jgi:hypothetical protein
MSLATETLAKLVQAKRSCLTRLREAGRRQLELINSGEMAALLDLLATKQRMLQQLQRIEQALDPFRQEDPRQRVWRTPLDRQSCAEEIAQCDALLAEVIELEKTSESALVRQRAETAARLEGIRAAAEAQRAYAAPAGEELSRLSELDLCSEG